MQAGAQISSNYPTGMVGADTQPARDTEVQHEVSLITTELKMMDETLSHLEALLSPVLADRKVGGAPDQSPAPEPVRVPLAHTLHDRLNHLIALRERVASMLSRLEL